MAWQIDPDREGEEAALGDYDGSGWYWGIVQDNHPSAADAILVKFTGTAMAMGEEALTERAALARQTLGKSEVEAVLGWPVPPSEIEITSEGVSRTGGNPGPEQLEINEITDWFTGRGATVFLIGRGLGRHRGSTLEMTRHSAYVAAKGSDSIMFKVEGESYLEAARAAKRKWEEDGLGVYVELQPAEGTSSASLQLETGRPTEIDPATKAAEAAEASRAETVNLTWEPLPGVGPEGVPVHILQVTRSDGVVVDIACGDDPEDSLLEIAEKLMPSWHKPPDAG
jgi:hypothetical protein